jgi:hypothetical protein
MGHPAFTLNGRISFLSTFALADLLGGSYP